MSSYFYIIEHKSSGKKYAGCKFAKDADPNNFMKDGGYTTSSPIINKIIAIEGLDAFSIVQIIIDADIDIHVHEYETNFLVENNIAQNPIWFNCHNNTIASFGTSEFQDMMIKTNGVPHSMQVPRCRELARATWIKKYGVDNPGKSEITKETGRQTSRNKYGADYASQTEQFRQKVVNTVQEKYGVDNISKDETVKNKKISTCMSNFGVEYPMQSAEVLAKVKTTSQEKYGVDHYTQSKQVKEKNKKTCFDRYGEDSWAKTPESRQQKSKRLKDTKWIRRLDTGESFQIKMIDIPNVEYEWEYFSPLNASLSANLIECPHCGRTFTKANFNRWHGDNCKVKPPAESQ